MENKKRKTKFFNLLGLVAVSTIPFVSCVSCNNPKPGPEIEYSVLVTNLFCQLSSSTVKARQESIITVTNKQTEIYNIVGVSIIQSGESNVLVEGQHFRIDGLSNEKITIHFFENVIVGDLKIILKLESIDPIVYYDINISSEDATPSINRIIRGDDLKMTIIPNDGLLIDHIDSVLVNGQPCNDFVFDNTTSFFFLSKDKITGNIEISLNTVSIYHNVEIECDGSKKDFVVISDPTAEHKKEYNTVLEIIPGHHYDCGFEEITITIGDGEPLAEGQYSFTIDSNYPYKAKLKINKGLIIDDVKIKVSLLEIKVGDYFVYFTDGKYTNLCPKVYSTEGFYYEMIMTDSSKYVDKIRVFVKQEGEEEKIELESNEFSLIDNRIIYIYPNARKGEFTVDLYYRCNQGTDLTNDSWENVSEYASYPWDRFAYIYPDVNGKYSTNPNYVGIKRKLKMNKNTYDVRVIGQKKTQLVDTSTLEGNTAYLTFEFCQVYSDSDGDGIEIKYGDPRDIYYDSSDVRTYINSGDFYSNLPDSIKKGARRVKNNFISHCEYREDPDWTSVENSFFILSSGCYHFTNTDPDRPVDDVQIGEEWYTEGNKDICKYQWYWDSKISDKERIERRIKKDIKGNTQRYYCATPVATRTGHSAFLELRSAIHTSGKLCRSGRVYDELAECIAPCFCI